MGFQEGCGAIGRRVEAGITVGGGMRGAIKSGGAGRTVLTTPTRSSARSSRDGGSIGRSRGRGGPFAAQRSTMFVRRLVARPLLASVKDSTGIVGLDVVPNARDVLISLYQQTLHAVQPIPASVQYRKSVEALTQHRLQVCQEEEDWQNIEKRIQGGQVEELIVQAKDELQLIPKMAEWKPWEVPEGYKVEVIEDDDWIPAHVPIHKQR